MTPAVNTLKKTGIRFKTHSYRHDPKSRSWGEDAAKKLGLPLERVFKTLVISVDGTHLSVAVVPVSTQLNLKKFAVAVHGKKAAMALKKDAERSTGYIFGGISPIAQKKKLKTVIDRSAEPFETIFVSAGRRGLQIELSPQDLANIVNADFFELT